MESPFIQFTNVNYIPSDEEIPAVAAIVDKQQRIVAQLDEEILEIEKTLSALMERREAHSKYLQDHQAFLSPARRLPVDILCSIFIASLPSSGLRHSMAWYPVTTNMTSSHMAVILSHVCQQWREISLGTPTLWSYIELCPRAYPLPTIYPPADIGQLIGDPSEAAAAIYRNQVAAWERGMDNLIVVLRTWLGRSASCPITIHLRAVREMDHDPRSWELMNILCGASTRWRNVTFQLTISKTTSPVLRLLHLPPISVPILRSFGFEICFSSPPGPMTQEAISSEWKAQMVSQIGLFSTPSLECLELPPLWGPILNIPVRWSSMTRLTFGGYQAQQTSPFAGTGLRNFGSKDALMVLKLCPRLIYCMFLIQEWVDDINLDSFQEPNIQVTEQITLPSLRSLNLRGCSIPYGFASSLILPNLHTLTMLGYAHTPRNENTSGLLDCITCFGSTLVSVSFDYSMLSQLALELCLSRLPVVEELNLTGQVPRYGYSGYPQGPEAAQAHLTSQVLQMLTPQFREKGNELLEPCCCPRLETFGCRLTSAGFVEQDLVDFVAARRRCGNTIAKVPISRIRFVSVVFAISKSMDVEEELKNRGVDMDDLFLGIENPFKPDILHPRMPQEYSYASFSTPLEDQYALGF